MTAAKSAGSDALSAVRTLLREAYAEGITDPRDAAEKVRPQVTDPEQLSGLTDYALVALARECAHRGRGSLAGPASHRWSAAAAETQDPLRWKVNVTGRKDGWRLLGECSSAELRSMAQLYAIAASRNSALAKQYRALADEMDRLKIAAVAEVPDDVLRRVLS